MRVVLALCVAEVLTLTATFASALIRIDSAVLDAAGGGGGAVAWGLAYGTVGLGGLAGAAALLKWHRSRETNGQSRAF